MKRCIKCGAEKPLTEYYKQAKMADGHLNKCKSCVRRYVSLNPAEYDKTEKGVIRVIYKTQKANQKKRGHGEMEYTKSDLKEWLYKNGFKKLYDDWAASGHKKDKKPSVDRIDDMQGYSLDNIMLGTWRDNRNKQYDDIMLGKGSSGKRCKVVFSIDPSTGKKKKYRSYSEAVREVGYSIFYPLKNSTQCKNGFYWQYA